LNSLHFRSDIQVFRGIAVAGVVLFHLDHQRFSIGYLGVDVFFVISGYLITPKITKIFELTRETQTTYIEIKKFYIGRLLRLGPALGVVILISSLLMVVIGKYSDLDRFFSQAIYSILGIANLGSYRNSGNYFNPDSNPLLHIWSLSIESQYYLLIPILLFALQQFNIKYTFKFNYKLPLVLIFGFSFFLFLNSNIELGIIQSFFPNINKEYQYYSLSSRMWQLLLGGLIGIFFNQIQRKGFVSKYLVTNHYFKFICILFIAILILNIEEPKWKIILVSFTTALLLADSTYVFKKIKFFEWIGNRSYSIYLIHFPTLYFFESAMDYAAYELNPGAYALIYLATLAIISNLSYTFVEKRYWHVDQKYNSIQKVLIISFILPLALVLTVFSQKTIIKSTLFIQPEMVEYGGRRIDPPVGFMDKMCKNQANVSRICIYNANKKFKTVVLIGDSYAEQYFETLSKLANELNFQLMSMTFPGCRFVISNNLESDFSKKCIDFNKQSLKELSLVPPDVVILSQALYSNEQSSQLIEAINELDKLNFDLIIVGNNPNFPDTSTYMVARPRLFGSQKPSKSFPRRSLENENIKLSSLLLDTMDRRAISTINPIPFFCDSRMCWRWSNGEWLYIDSNHLSVSGADLLAPVFRRSLELHLK
jgi:peptidoglycan/LPS O-acetylase OafA/YrhL